MAKKIKTDATVMDAIVTMAEGNPGALAVLVNMLEKPIDLYDILFLDSIDIRGSRLYMLNNDCCGRDSAKFKRTLLMLRFGVFTQRQINENLSRCRAIPFIDDSIKIDGVPPYGEDFYPTHSKWDEWCGAQVESFERRMAKK